MRSKNGELNYSNIEEKKPSTEEVVEDKKIDMWED